MQCSHWAQKCLLIAKHTHFVDESDAPLDPLMAISLFFAEQEAALATHKNADDQTIKRLYNIAMEVLDCRISLQQSFQDTVNAILVTHEKLINKALKEVDKQEGDNRKVRKILVRALRYNSQVKQRYVDDGDDSSSSSSIKLPPRLALSDTPSSSSTAIVAAFVNNYKRDAMASTGRMNWNACLVAGRAQGLFSRYATGPSLRAWYNRIKE